MATRIFQLVIEGINQGAYRATVLHFSTGGSNDNDTVAACESLCNGWDAHVKTQFLATLPPTYNLNQISARRLVLKPSASAILQYQWAAYAGTRGINSIAEQTCPVVFLVPTMGTKSGGRIFWPSIPDGDLVTSTPSAGWQTAVNTAITTMITGFANAGITWTLGIFSRKLQTIANIASHQFSPVVGFQSRRRKPIGAN